MRRSPALPWALALLDDGLRLYRRHLPGFLLVTSAVMAPMVMVNLLLTALVRTQLGPDWLALGTMLALLLQYPATLYAWAVISRAAAAALDGEPIRVTHALRLSPLRAAGMGCYNLLFTLLSGTLGSIMIVSIACPILYSSIFGAGLLSAVGGTGTFGAAGGLFTVLLMLIILWVVVVSGATLSSVVYSVQAFALERRPFGATITRSVDLLTFRLGGCLLVFLGAGAIITTLMFAYTGALIVGGQSLLQFLDVELSDTARDVLTVTTSTASFVLVLPPLPIWMAMLHRSLAAERDGADLLPAIERWRAAFEA